MSGFPSTRKFGLWRLLGRCLWGSSRAGRQLAALCFNLVVFSLSSSHLSVVPSKAQLLFRIYSFPFIQAFQGEFFHVTVLFSFAILFLQKHVHCFKFSLSFFFLKWDNLFIFSPCLFSLLSAAASPAGAALLVAREMFFFHFYCNLLIFSPLWAQNLLLLPNEALGINNILYTTYT